MLRFFGRDEKTNTVSPPHLSSPPTNSGANFELGSLFENFSNFLLGKGFSDDSDCTTSDKSFANKSSVHQPTTTGSDSESTTTQHNSRPNPLSVAANKRQLPQPTNNNNNNSNGSNKTKALPPRPNLPANSQTNAGNESLYLSESK